LNNVKTKFEQIANTSDQTLDQPKPLRRITPPREGADRVEIENQPMQRSADVVSAYEKVEDTLPDSGYIRSRKEIFSNNESDQKSAEPPRVKSITPPREEATKRILKELTPERNENVVRESDRSEDILPQAGQIKQTAAMFLTNRQKSIERSGIVIEGELTEKGIAKSRLALFNDPNAITNQNQNVSTAELEQEYIKNASGIAKERLNLFKNLEQQQNQSGSTSRASPPKKLKEFTPPPQLDPHLQQQRQYIIIDKENSPSSNAQDLAQGKNFFI
jgi:hypothetical protein